MPKRSGDENLRSKYIKITVVVIAYWITSIVTVFVNKALLDSSLIGLDAPIFVTWFQCFITTIICFVSDQIKKSSSSTKDVSKISPLNIGTIRKVLPLSILFALMISTNNLCLKYVGVAFYYIGRSLTTVFNVLFSYCLLGERTNLSCIYCCAIIVVGFWLGVDQESLTESFSMTGTIFGVAGSLFLSLYSIYTKKTLSHIGNDVWTLTYFNNIYSCFLLIPIILTTGEYQQVLRCDHLFELWFLATLTVGGICGFAIGIVTALQIKLTSPLTHNISGTAKACAQTVIATEWFNESKSFLWWLSNIVVLLASAFYARIKQQIMKKQFQNVNNINQKV